MPARILYGVQGEGRGHASRSLQVIQWLMAQGHSVKVLTGGDALPVPSDRGMDLVEIPMLRYRFAPDGSLSPRRTILANLQPALGLCAGMGRSFARVAAIAEAFDPDLIISDFEPYASRLARIREVPLVAIDHQHFLTESALPVLPGWQKTLKLRMNQLGTYLLGGRPDRIIASSFHHFPRRRGSRAIFVGAFIPEALRTLRPESGESVTVYLKQPKYLDALLPVLRDAVGTEFRVFSAWGDSPPADLPPHIRPGKIDREAFLDSLARSKALLTTAGNQVVGEAIFLRKPVLAFPEPDVLEQELNALALTRSGCGESFPLNRFEAGTWSRFEGRLPHYQARLEAAHLNRDDLDGRIRALRVLGRILRSLPVAPGLRTRAA